MRKKRLLWPSGRWPQSIVVAVAVAFALAVAVAVAVTFADTFRLQVSQVSG